MEQQCGEEAAKYVSDFIAHGFQIIIDAKGEDCDVTGESLIYVMVIVQFTLFHSDTSIYLVNMSKKFDIIATVYMTININLMS